MMRVLAFDTATEILSVAVGDVTPLPQRTETSTPEATAERRSRRSAAHPNAGNLLVENLFSVVQDRGLRHSEGLLPTIETILRQSSGPIDEVDLIAVSLGPGSFTGLRIGLATAKGLALAQGIPFVQVDNLAVYGALWAPFDGQVLPVIDAKKKHFYAAVYCEGKTLMDPCDAAPTDIIGSTLNSQRVIVTGPHAPLFLERLAADLDDADLTRFAIDPYHRRGIAAGMLVPAFQQYDANGPAAVDCAPR